MSAGEPNTVESPTSALPEPWQRSRKRAGIIVAVWDVKADAESQQWAFTPLVAVGPLRFGVGHEQVCRALDTAPIMINHDPAGRSFPDAWFRDLGVRTYYAGSKLAAVAVDASTGPQVTLAGRALVGQVPSRFEDWLCDYAEPRGLLLAYTYEGRIGSPDLGLLMRVQHAGAQVLTQPVFMTGEWAQGLWDRPTWAQKSRTSGPRSHGRSQP
ncbi:hypothetical protein ABZS66_18625 [Dactylosporangium sp. NPDC005572]|uniref:hypothetical protein n=1 Tax=Dactylosporangium sp. NPDC005572 TaxID=3156889 RepID=UPI0033B4C4A7